MNTHIIGGGIIGLTIALNLCQRGETVTLHEAETPFGGASLGNAGHIATEYNYPVASLATLRKLPAMLINPLGPLRIDWRYLPKMLPWGWQMFTNMLPARYQHNHRALLALNRESLAAWERLAARWQLAPLLRHPAHCEPRQNRRPPACIRRATASAGLSLPVFARRRTARTGTGARPPTRRHSLPALGAHP